MNKTNHHIQQGQGMSGYWRVLEEHPRPDNYIAIIGPDLSNEIAVPHSTYSSREAAINRGKQLLNRYSVRNIKIFHINGTSILTRSK